MAVIHQTGRVSVPLLLAVVIWVDILVTVSFKKGDDKSTVRVSVDVKNMLPPCMKDCLGSNLHWVNNFMSGW